MATITIEPATAARFDDAQHTLTGGGEGRSCKCQWWMMSNADFQRTTVDDRMRMLKSDLAAPVPPALIARVDGDPAGWVRVGPRTTQPRLARTRLLTEGSAEPWDDPSVWAVTCFVVRREHRGEGVAARLLDAAVDHAREHGARVVEGYPVDPAEGRKHSSNELYHGTVSMFLAAGFQEVARPKPDRPIVALPLAE